MGWVYLTVVIVLSTALWPLSRWALSGDGNPRVMGFWLCLTAGVASLAVLLARHGPLLVPSLWIVAAMFSVARTPLILIQRKRERVGGVALGLFNTISTPLTILAFKHLGSEIVLPVSVTLPTIMVLILGAVLYRERLSRLTWAGCLLAALSVGLIGYGSTRGTGPVGHRETARGIQVSGACPAACLLCCGVRFQVSGWPREAGRGDRPALSSVEGLGRPDARAARPYLGSSSSSSSYSIVFASEAISRTRTKDEDENIQPYLRPTMISAKEETA